MMTKNKLLTIVFSLVCVGLFAQEKTSYTGDIKNDSLLGLKKIALTPALRAVANSDFSDLRIYDANKQQAPYFIQEYVYKTVAAEFVSVENKVTNTKTETEVTINNPDKKIFHAFTFQLSNADVQKNCKIEGSDNNKKWYVISEKIYLNLSKNTTEGFNYYNINFPSIDYKHIRLVINDSLSAPIHIKDIGHFKYKKSSNEFKYQSLDYKYAIHQKEKETLIHITADRAYEINKLSLSIDNPKLFSREATFYTLDTLRKKPRKQVIDNIYINSKTTNTFKDLNIKQKDFWIAIDNKDNQPLSIVGIDLYQKEKYLVADLKSNEKYNIVAGDKKLKKPSYDLVHFTDDIAYNLPLLKIENENVITQEKTSVQKEKSFYEEAWFMWVCIGVVAVIILFFTLSLLKKTEEL